QRLTDGEVSDTEARWAVDTWAMALGKHPSSSPAARRASAPAAAPEWDQHAPHPVAPPSGSLLGAAGMWQLLLVALAGLVGGLLPPALVWYLTPEALLQQLGVPLPPEEVAVAKDEEANPHGIQIIKPGQPAKADGEAPHIEILGQGKQAEAPPAQR